MDVTLLTFLALAIGILIIILTTYLQRLSGNKETQRGIPEAEPPIRRAAGARNARRRLQANTNVPANVAPNRSENEEDDIEEEDDKLGITDHKIGAKKKAKLEAKAEKKAHREAVEREREERKKREELLQIERDKQSEKERAEELKREEAERKAREEKERKEHEEYLKMKEAFSIEEEGYDEENAENFENLLEKFVNYIKENKVVILEDLAAQFGIKTTCVIQRIQDLQASGHLTGVIDDRGKFIYISKDELNAIVKFVQQRGRVSISELAENSNCLINLNPQKSVESR